jgi:hypothetical protein
MHGVGTFHALLHDTHIPSFSCCRLFHEEVKYRLLMSLDGANGSMNQPTDLSMSVEPANLSMPMDAGFSMPFDDAMSMPMDAGMSMPFDDAMSIDLALSMAAPADSIADVCEGNHPSTPVSKSFEVDGPVGMLSDVLKAAVEDVFTLCPSPTRMLWENQREMEESVVLGVEVKGVAADENATCSEGAVEECRVATAKFDVIYEEGATKEAATDEFLTKLSQPLAERLAEVDGVRERADASASPDSSSTETTPSGVDSPSDRGLGGGEKAAAVVCSLAVVAVVLVLVQRKITKNKRDDDKSVAESLSTAPNTSAYTSSNSIF